jgi:CubicO group peptidase (beta-lactamase class C family)
MSHHCISIATLLFICISTIAFGQRNFATKIDSLIESQTQKPFNGVIIVSQDGKTIYSKNYGFSDLDKKTRLHANSQFVLASISKQITAVLVLQEVDRGRLGLHDPVKKYLPQLKVSWADSVTVHQLLNHTSGIVGADKPLAFKPGTQFAYSPSFTYQLLGQIIEKTSGKTYAALAKDLFSRCNMKNTTTPALYTDGDLVNSYHAEAGTLKKINLKLSDLEPASPGAGIISTANDLVAWNNCLHNGKLLSKASYESMTTSTASRKHPVWGEVGYGYGIQINRENNLLEISHSGSSNAYNSINFYYPATKTSLILLSSTNWYSNDEDITKPFYFHTQIRKIILENELMKSK